MAELLDDCIEAAVNYRPRVCKKSEKKVCNVPAAKRAKLARHSSQARERGVVSEEGIFKLVNISDKMQVVSGQKKYRAMSDSLTEYIS